MHYSDALMTARMQLVSDLVASKTPAASTGSASAGQLVIGDATLSGLTGILATLALPSTPFAISGSGTVVAVLQGVPISAIASASGIAAKAELRNNAGQTVVSGLSVGTLNTDIVLASTTIVAGTPLQVTSGVITHG